MNATIALLIWCYIIGVIPWWYWNIEHSTPFIIFRDTTVLSMGWSIVEISRFYNSYLDKIEKWQKNNHKL